MVKNYPVFSNMAKMAVNNTPLLKNLGGRSNNYKIYPAPSVHPVFVTNAREFAVTKSLEEASKRSHVLWLVVTAMVIVVLVGLIVYWALADDDEEEVY